MNKKNPIVYSAAAAKLAEVRFRETYPGVEFIEYFPGNSYRSELGGSLPSCQFFCTICDEPTEIQVQTLRKRDPARRFVCLSCAQDLRVPHCTFKYSLDQVQEAFKARGVTPLFTEYSWKKPLRFLCSCGQNENEVYLSNVKYSGSESLQLKNLRCGPCHSNWRRETATDFLESADPYISPEARASMNYRDSSWPSAVLRKANFTCALSGKKDQPLAAHHLYWHGRHPERRLDISNGIALTQELHQLFHRLYRPRDTPDEVSAYFEFESRYHSGEF